MKKTILGLFALCMAFATLSFVGCNEGGTGGKTQEELFNEAKQQFDNYTAEIKMNFSDGSEGLEIVYSRNESACQIVYSVAGDDETYTDYIREENGVISYYDSDSETWENDTESTTIEEAAAELTGYALPLITGAFYGDFEEQNGELALKKTSLDSYSEQLGFLTVTSLRITLKNGTFVSAAAVLSDDGVRLESNYTFKNYGTTQVKLPD